MKKLIYLSIFVFALIGESPAQPIFTTQAGNISFFSTTPVEDINATNKSVRGLLNTTNNEVHFIAPIRQFKFPKALMEEHFNENYMESDKFPNATFDGTIQEKIDFTKDGTYDVTSKGKLKIHGVEQERTEKGKLTIKGTEIRLECAMKVKVADFNIEIPKIVFQNIAETIDVKIDAPFTPYKKP